MLAIKPQPIKERICFGDITVHHEMDQQGGSICAVSTSPNVYERVKLCYELVNSADEQHDIIMRIKAMDVISANNGNSNPKYHVSDDTTNAMKNCAAIAATRFSEKYQRVLEFDENLGDDIKMRIKKAGPHGANLDFLQRTIDGS